MSTTWCRCYHGYPHFKSCKNSRSVPHCPIRNELLPCTSILPSLTPALVFSSTPSTCDVIDLRVQFADFHHHLAEQLEFLRHLILILGPANTREQREYLHTHVASTHIK